MNPNGHARPGFLCMILSSKHIFQSFQHEEPIHAVFQPCLSLAFSAAGSDFIPPAAGPLQKRAAAGGQPAVLRLGRAEVHPAHARLHHPELSGRPASCPAARPGQNRRAGAGGGGQPGPAGVLQVLQLRRGHSGCPAAPPGAAGARNRPAVGHQFLHLPGHELHHRPVPRQHPAAEKLVFAGAVHQLLPPAGGRADRALQRGGSPAAQPHRRPDRLLLRHQALSVRSLQKGDPLQLLCRPGG